MSQFKYDFRTGYPDTTQLIPQGDLIDITNQLLRTRQATQYAGDVRGLPASRVQLARFVSDLSDQTCQPDELIITNGAIHAVDLVCRRLSNPGDMIAVEEPTFYYMKRVFNANHLQTVSVPMGDDGIDLIALEQSLQQHAGQIKLLYTIPTFHNPTGHCMSADARQRLVELAQRYQFVIIEDATYQSLYFDAPPPPLCKDYDDTHQHIITVGSFSKILMPALRLGWLWTTNDTVDQIAQIKSDAATSALTSSIASEFIAQGKMTAQVERARAYYRHRRDVFVTALAEHLPDNFQWQAPAGGFFVWVELPDDIRASDILRLAQTQDVDFGLGTMCFLEDVPDHTMRLCFTLLDDVHLRDGVQRLAQAIHSLQGQSVS
jgi:2-aminoadipate transaminase